MRQIIRDFFADLAGAMELPGPVVELGSRPASGQEDIADLRGFFPGREYIGCDLQAGPGVDRVEDMHALSFADGFAGTVISADTLEHVADPLRAVREMHRVLRPGGVCAITSVMFFPIHAHPWDYWRFTPEGFQLLLEPFESCLAFGFGHQLLPEAVYGVGVKGPAPDLHLERLPRTAAHIRDWGKGQPVDLGPIRMTLGQAWSLAARETAREARRRLGRP